MEAGHALKKEFFPPKICKELSHLPPERVAEGRAGASRHLLPEEFLPNESWAVS